MEKRFSPPAKLWRTTMLLALLLTLPISTTGCARRLVVIDGSKTLCLPVQTVNDLYSDNEALLAELERCRE